MKFNFHKLFKRLIYFCGGVLFLVILLLFCSPYLLKKADITIGSIQYRFPSTLLVQHFELNKPNFKLKIDSSQVDIRLSHLLNGEYVGNKLQARGVDIVVIPTDAPFSYSVIPYISFKELSLTSASLSVLNTPDTIFMDFPRLFISDLVWNDSILVNELIYENGLYQQRKNKHVIDSSASSPIHVPDGVPKFHVNHLQLTNTKIDIQQFEKGTIVSGIHLNLLGLNNNNGADLKLKELKFVIQDSIAIQLKSEKLVVENLKGAGIHHLNLDLKGADLNIRELSVIETKNGKSIHFILDKSKISPSLLQYFSQGGSPFKEAAAPFEVESELVYENDSLLVKNVSLSLLKKTNLRIHGSIVNPGKENQLHLSVSPLCINGDELAQLFKMELPSAILEMQSCSELKLEGSLEKLHIKGSINYNETPINLDVRLDQSTNKHLLANVTLNSRYFDLAQIMPSSQQDLKIYNLSIQSTFDINEKKNFNHLSLYIVNDSIRSHSLVLNKTELKTIISEEDIQFYIESKEQDWKLYLNGKKDDLKQQSISFSGEVHIKNLAKINPAYKTGEINSTFKGELLNQRDSLMAYLNLEKLSIRSRLGQANKFDQTELAFMKNKGSYQITVKSHSKPIVEAKFTDALLQWFKKPNWNPKALPYFYFKLAFELDSNLTEQFFGQKIQLNLKNLELVSNEQGFTSNLDIPFASLFPFYIENLKSTVKYSETEKYLNWLVNQIRNPYLNIDSLGSQMYEATKDSMVYTLNGKLPSINQVISFGGGLKLNPSELKFSYDDQNILQFGEQKWTNKRGNQVSFNTTTYEVIGDLNLSNGNQKINFNGNKESLNLAIEEFELGPFADFFLKENNLDASLNVISSFKIKQKSLTVKGKIQDINLDTISLGYTLVEGALDSSSVFLNLTSGSSAWLMNLTAQQEKEKSELNLIIEKLNLAKLNSVLGLFSKDYSLKGNINGRLKIGGSEQLSSIGQLNFDSVYFTSHKLGTSTLIDKQSIQLENKDISFNNFKLVNQNSEKLFIRGGIKLAEIPKFDLGIYTQKYAVLSNRDPKSDLKGKLEIESDLKIQGDLKNLTVSGKLNLLKGGDVDYYYKSTVSLDGTNEVVTFISFEEQKGIKFKRIKKERQFPINWDVHMDIGNTDIFILLSKSKQEFVKLNAGGQLRLRKGSSNLPSVYGELSSNEGKIYHDLPMVSNVNLDIKLAKANWKGDLTDPAISFKGVETFRVTPYEMSSEFSDKQNKVPVDVTVEIDNKTVKNLELHFDINSGNAQIQNMLSSLPADTKETYAINMLVHGKVNTDAKSTEGSMGGVVNKLNEISRRNLKNADLSFHSDNTAVTDENGTQNASRIGYNLSKDFYNQKFKVSVGGNFDVGATTAASKSSPLGTIQLEYQLKEDPNISIQLKRENSYRGPIEGQVDESGVILNFSRTYKNIFIRSTKQKQDTLEQKK